MTRMVYEIATILLGAAFGAALVLYAAPRGFFGHPRKRVTTSATTYAPTTSTEQVVDTTTTVTNVTEAPPVTEPAPSPAPTQAIYETVQPDTTPPPPVAPSAATPVVSFGGSAKPSAPRTYRRRTANRRNAATKSTPHRTRKR